MRRQGSRVGQIRLLLICAALAVGLLGTAARSETPEQAATRDGAKIRLENVDIFVEVNDTSGNAGIQMFLDGEGWDSMTLMDPNGNMLFDVNADGGVGAQGITEFFFESAEPSFDVQTLEELLALFPEGDYSFRGTTTEGKKLNGKSKLTHAIPDAPPIKFPAAGELVNPNWAWFEWGRVPNPPGSRIVGYDVSVWNLNNGRTFAAELGSKARTITVPPEFMDPATEYKFEVLAIERSGNRTISEREFTTQD